MGTVRRAIKRDARAALKGNWSTAILITLILMVTAMAIGLLEAAIPLVLGVPAYLQAVAQSEDIWQAVQSCAPLYLLFAGLLGLVSLIFFAPLSVGTADWYTACTQGERNGPGHIFWPFGCGKFWGALLLQVALAVVQLFWSLLFLILPAGLLGLAIYNLYSLQMEPVMQTLTITGALAAGLLLIVMLLLLAVFLGRYSLAVFLMGKRYNKGPLGALAMSARITKGHLFETFWFALSLLPWQILSNLLLPALYGLPYMNACWAMYTRYLVELEENKGKAPIPAEPEPAPEPEAHILPAPAEPDDPNKLFDQLAAQQADEILEAPEAEFAVPEAPPEMIEAEATEVEEPCEEDLPVAEE